MNITRQRFDSGLTYDEYKATMTRNLDALENNERLTRISASDLIALKSLPAPLNVVAIVEDWCGDVIAGLPVVGRLAADSGMLNLRVFARDANLDLMDQCLKEGKYRSIPAFIFLDGQLNEIGRLIERPAAVTDRLASARRDIFAANPGFGQADTPMDQLAPEAREQVVAGMRAVREQERDWINGELIREVLAIVKSGSAPAIVPSWRRPPAATTPKGPMRVRITYCSACGYEPQTLELVKALMYAMPFELTSIEVAPGEEGAFDVTANGELIHSMFRDGGFGETDAIVAAVRSKLA